MSKSLINAGKHCPDYAISRTDRVRPNDRKRSEWIGCREPRGRETEYNAKGKANMRVMRIGKRLDVAIRLPDMRQWACAARAARQVRSGMLDGQPK